MDALFDKGRRGYVGPLRFVWLATAAVGSTPSANEPESLPSVLTDGFKTDSTPRALAQTSEAGVSVLFSVPKKVFKLAWKRNLIKRRMRESYRQRKHELLAAAQAAGRQIDIALICSPAGAKGSAAATRIPDFNTIDNAVGTILTKILERS